MTILHRVDKCPKCSYPTLARRGRTLCCSAKLSKIKDDIKIKARRCRKNTLKPLWIEAEEGAVCSLLNTIGNE